MLPLRSAKRLKISPTFKQTRKTPAQAKGLAYEIKGWKALGKPERGIWLRAVDTEGSSHLLQPDLVIDLAEWQVASQGEDPGLLVLEFKLTWRPTAEGQVRRYAEALSLAVGRPARGMIVCRNLRRGISGVVQSIEEGLKRDPKSVPIVHWTGILNLRGADYD